MKFPHLPKKQVNKVIIGNGYNEEIYKSLLNLNIEPIFSARCTNVRSGIHNHADIGVCPLLDNKFLLSKEQYELSEILRKNGYNTEFINENLDFNYPSDVFLNCVIIGKYIIYNPNTVSDKITEYIKNNDLIEIIVKQGYTKCSIAPLTIDTFITDDISIGSRAVEFGMDVLVINKGEIKLKDFNYGFIGGATGKISEDKLVITGNAKKLSDYDKIKNFLYKKDIELISLTNCEIEDIGSIIPVY